MKFSDTFTKEGWRVILEGAYTLIGGGGTPGKRTGEGPGKAHESCIVFRYLTYHFLSV